MAMTVKEVKPTLPQAIEDERFSHLAAFVLRE
jgi:hypothetical protein